MKKLLLTLGAVAAVATPVASVIACGSNGDEDSTKKLTLTSSMNKADLEAIEATSVTSVPGAMTTLGITIPAEYSALADTKLTWDKSALTLKIEGKSGAAGEEKEVAVLITVKPADAPAVTNPGAGTIAADFNSLTDAEISTLNAKLAEYATAVQAQIISVTPDPTDAAAVKQDAKKATYPAVAKLVRVSKTKFEAAKTTTKRSVKIALSANPFAELTEADSDTVVVFNYKDAGFGQYQGYYASADDFKTATGIAVDAADNFWKIDYSDIETLLSTLKVA